MLSYTELKKAWRSWWNRRQSKAVRPEPPYKLYRRCSQLSFDRFITCIVDGDLTALVISGSPTSEELAVAWGEIYFEYVDLSGDNETKFIIALERDITLLHDQIATVEAIYYFLQPVMIEFARPHLDNIHAALKDYGYRIKIDPTQDYSKKLKQIEGKLALAKVELAQKEKEYQSIVEGRETNTLTREYFKKILLRLSKYMGGSLIREKDITVEEYVFLLRDYVQYVEQLNKKGGSDGE